MGNGWCRAGLKRSNYWRRVVNEWTAPVLQISKFGGYGYNTLVSSQF